MLSLATSSLNPSLSGFTTTRTRIRTRTRTRTRIASCWHHLPHHKPASSSKWAATLLLNAGVGLALVGPAIAEQSPLMLELTEPSNALSLPTWAVHVSSVLEWIIAMALVWQYGQKPGNESWKGLSWGMVPLLGGAMCACTWHFFYNAETLEALVVLQAALTFFGNVTLCIAAFRIYQSRNQSENI